MPTHDAVPILETFLSNIGDPATIRAHFASNATYVSLAHDSPDLRRAIPFAGAHTACGPEGIIETYAHVAKLWEIVSFEVDEKFGADGKAVAFGRMELKSRRLGKVARTPFALMMRLNAEGKVEYMQFMEDTFATAASLRRSGKWTVEADPDGGSVEVPAE